MDKLMWLFVLNGLKAVEAFEKCMLAKELGYKCVLYCLFSGLSVLIPLRASFSLPVDLK